MLYIWLPGKFEIIFFGENNHMYVQGIKTKYMLIDLYSLLMHLIMIKKACAIIYGD